MNATDRLTELFMRFPGIGPKQAKRFVYFLLREHSQYKEQLIKALEELKFTGKQCEKCYRFFGDRNAQTAKIFCNICDNESRDHSEMMIVEKELDLDAIEKTGSYNGLYFILGGLVPPLTEKPSELVRIRELTSRIHGAIEAEMLSEVIFALPVTDYGDITTQYVEKIIKQIVGIDKVKLSHLARGLSSGLELEYVDRDTFKSALERRN
ncbi:TPA: recombination protein RecR [Candidatus Nomurabacteria bacterium]|nr:recombination protein RecR [Candidatus Nomurabacteria bacterium]